MPKSIKIFLGSSIVELANERQDISLLTKDISTMFKLGDIDVEFVLCENIETGNDGKWGHDDQAIIDENLCKCDVSLFLFRSKAGKWTRHEYEVASKLQKEGKHKFFVYYLRIDEKEKEDSLKDFQQQLDNDGVPVVECNTLSDAKYKFAIDLTTHLGVTLANQAEIDDMVKTGDLLYEKYTFGSQPQEIIRAKLHEQIEVVLSYLSSLKDSTLFRTAIILQGVKLYKKADHWAMKTSYSKERYYHLLSEYAYFLYESALYKESETINARAITLAEELYGIEHENTAFAYNRIGMVYYNIDEYKMALDYFGKAQAIWERAPEQYYPEIANTSNNIGGIYRKQGNYDMALDCFDKVLKIQKKNLDANRLRIAETYNNKGVAFRYKDLFKESLDSYLKALEIQEDILGKNHVETAITYANIGTTYRYLGNYNKALEYYQLALDADIATRGINNDYTAVDYHNIASVHRLQGNFQEALKYYLTALAIEEKVLGVNHPNTATEYNNIGLLYSDMGNNSMALEYYEKALEVYKTRLVPNHPSIATIYNNIGVIYLDKGDYAKAKDYLNKALEIKRDIYDDNNTSTANTIHYLGKLFYLMRDNEKAVDYLEEAFRIRHDNYGDDHPETKETKDLLDNINKAIMDKTK